MDQANPSPDTADVLITIGIDGRVYFHELTEAVLPLAEAMNPRSPEILGRLAACSTMRTEDNHEYANRIEQDQASAG